MLAIIDGQSWFIVVAGVVVVDRQFPSLIDQLMNRYNVRIGRVLNSNSISVDRFVETSAHIRESKHTKRHKSEKTN